ncbi:MAG: hypothetical protein WBQ66_16025 [Blastocatellia bacterium]|jgi:hypothetical protein
MARPNVLFEQDPIEVTQLIVQVERELIANVATAIHVDIPSLIRLT